MHIICMQASDVQAALLTDYNLQSSIMKTRLFINPHILKLIKKCPIEMLYPLSNNFDIPVLKLCAWEWLAMTECTLCPSLHEPCLMPFFKCSRAQYASITLVKLSVHWVSNMLRYVMGNIA